MRPSEPQAICRYDSLDHLVCAARRGDRPSFGRLVERYERTVYAIVYRRLRDHDEAQEVCQEVFIRALRKLDQLRDPQCFGGWLRSIANRMAINRAVRRGPLVTVGPDVFENSCVEDETPLRAAMSHERASQVHVGLGRLRETDRATLMAFYFDGRSIIEMSEKFDSPVGTIKRRLHTARKRLAKELEAMAIA